MARGVRETDKYGYVRIITGELERFSNVIGKNFPLSCVLFIFFSDPIMYGKNTVGVYNDCDIGFYNDVYNYNYFLFI